MQLGPSLMTRIKSVNKYYVGYMRWLGLADASHRDAPRRRRRHGFPIIEPPTNRIRTRKRLFACTGTVGTYTYTVYIGGNIGAFEFGRRVSHLGTLGPGLHVCIDCYTQRRSCARIYPAIAIVYTCIVGVGCLGRCPVLVVLGRSRLVMTDERDLRDDAFLGSRRRRHR